MPRSKKVELRLPLKLTAAQRNVLAELRPRLTARLKLDEPNARMAEFTVAELAAIKSKSQAAMNKAGNGVERRLMRFILEAADSAIGESQSLPPEQTVFQFKITVLESHPPIWRRIQVKDCTLDELHEHIQTAMGWTNSHLHQFIVDGQRFGDPELMEEDFEEMGYADSTTTRISTIVPKDRPGFRLNYEYDFGDSWEHEVLFEGVVRAGSKVKYPVCVEGARACPPEDCGGIWGYADFLEAIRDARNPEHEEMLEWIGGYFDPEAFNPARATKSMRKGLPDWRRFF